MPLVSIEPPPEEPPTTAGGAPIPVDVDDGPPPAPSKDEVFEVLRAGRRREVLRYLDAHGGEAPVGTLAEHVAAEENGVEPALIAPAQRKRAYVALHQIHLPKLDDYGVVEYDRDAGTVRLLGPAWWYVEYLYFEPGGGPFRAPGAPAPASALRRLVDRLLGRWGHRGP